MFEVELNFFIQNQDELVKQHGNKVLALKGAQVIGVYATLNEAYFETQKQHALGTFMLQPCKPGASAYTVTFSSGVIGSH